MSIQRDIDTELRFHFDARIEELVSQGMSGDAARAQAIAEFGDVDHTRSALREIGHRVATRRRRTEVIDGVLQDVRYAVRSLRRTPVVALTIILTLALGLGANAAMFSLLDTIFLKPPAGVAHPEAIRRVWVQRNFRDGLQYWPGFDYARYDAITKAVAGQAVTTFYRHPEQRTITQGENAPRALVSGAASNYFSVLGVTPAIGRFYTADEGGLTLASPVAVIADDLWKRQYGGSPDVLGKTILLAGEKFTIIGVTPPGFRGMELNATDVWIPMVPFLGSRARGRLPWWRNSAVNGFLIVMRPSAGAREAELTRRMTQALRRPNIGTSQDTLAISALGAIQRARGPGKVTAAMQVATRLVGVAIIVLLIACANVVNLLLARAVERRREIAVRLALGVSRARLVRFLVTETVILAVLAAASALVAARWGGALLRGLLMPEVTWAASPLDWRVLVFSLVVAVLAGALAGLIPALQSASPDLTASLKSGALEGGIRRSRLRGFLVTVQAALSVVLLVGAVLFVRSLHNVKARDIGYTVDRLTFASVSYDVPDAARDAVFPQRLRALEERIAAVPGVERVASTAARPKYSFSSASYYPDADTVLHKKPDGLYSVVSPGYFEAVGMKLLYGRTFEKSRDTEGPPPVVISKAMADGLWPGKNALGRCVRFERPDAPCGVVIGVVQNAIVLSFDEPPRPSFFASLDRPALSTWGARDLVIRGAPDRLPAIQASVRAVLRDEFPSAMVSFTSMSQSMEPDYRPWDLGAKLFTLFGVLALAVAAIGVYSTVSYAVNQRTHEFGVRTALGARASDILGQVVAEGVRTVLIGIVAGVLLALTLGRFVRALLYGIAPSDPLSIVIVAIVLVAIALVATLLPAWRASRADPVSALRSD